MMYSQWKIGALALMACCIFGGHAFAQANIKEGPGVWLYVNGSSGSNSNSGRHGHPLKTVQAGINKAIAYAKSGVEPYLLIYPGTYRESLTLNYHSRVPITIQAYTMGKAVIDGADRLINWHKIDDNVYEVNWNDTVDGCRLPNGWYSGMPPIVQANEMVFINGQPLTQVMSEHQMHAGTFYIYKAYNQVRVYPPPGVNIYTADVEVAARRSTLTVNGSSNIVFRGLVFQHAASCMNQTGVTVGSSNNILFDRDTANWNNWGALGISSSSNVTVENTTASHNGGSGLNGYEDVNTLWQNNETDYNNWRGSMVGLYDFAQGGTKLMRMHGATVNNQTAYNNASQGLWFDTDNMNITVSGAKLVGNLVGNLQLEANQGPIAVRRSSFCSGGGVQVINTADLVMTGNTFYDNGGHRFQNGQFFLAGKSGGRRVTNWQTGAVTYVYTKNTKLAHNAFIGVGSNQFVFNTYLSGYDWSQYINTLLSYDNHWYDSSNPSAFGIPAGKHLTFGSWKNMSGQDSSSTWGWASSNCGVPWPDFTDFQLLAHNAASYVSSYTMSGGKVGIPLEVRSFHYGRVYLSISGLPSGVTASFSHWSLYSGDSTLTLRASNWAKYQTVPITIFAVSGGRVHTLTLKVNVRPS